MIGGFNVLGSLFFGWAGQRWNKLALLGGIYIVRSIALVLVFHAAGDAGDHAAVRRDHGASSGWASGRWSRACGRRNVRPGNAQAMIQGLAFMSHQLGSFLGAYGGGLIYDLAARLLHHGVAGSAWRWVLAGGIIQVALRADPAEPAANRRCSAA